MRLLNVNTLKFADFTDDTTRPRYVIASHRWGADEAKYRDVEQGRRKDTLGYKKVEAFAEYVRKNVKNVEWLWIDTCCIDKDSAAELSYAINSMFRWYRNADLCIAYLPKVVAASDVNAFGQDEWFGRGWTLQELLAPPLVVFVTKDWQVIGSKGPSSYGYDGTLKGPDLTANIAQVTKIPEQVLRDWAESASVRNEDKMRWIEGRKTTVKEDMLYALFGIVGVTLPVIYGEGEQNARNRLFGDLRQRDEIRRDHADEERKQNDIKEENARKWQEIVGWLAPPNPWTNHESARKLYEQHTGAWLLNSRKYQAWKEGQGFCLWLYGGAGCGKTILCSTAIKDMEEHCRRSPDNYGHAIFYFSFSDKGKQQYEDLLLSLIAQLGNSHSPAFTTLKQAYEEKEKKRPGREDLEEILREFLASYSLVFCHLDALDECPEEDEARKHVLQGIQRLRQCVSNLRIMVTSRDESDIRQSMEQLRSMLPISVGSDLVTPDIRQYIRTQIETMPKLRRLDVATKTFVEETLSERAAGMFRYVYCQLQELSRSRNTKPASVRKALLALPESLDQTYERMLTRINPDDQSDALTLLRWLAYSYVPLTLEQLAEASIIDPTDDPGSDGVVDVDNKGNWTDTLEILAGLVVAIGHGDGEGFDYEAQDEEAARDEQDGEGANDEQDEKAANDEQESITSFGDDPFVSSSSRRIPKDTKVRLAHFSVKEYLQSNRITEGKARVYHLDPGREHRFLTHSCLAYLTYYSEDPRKLSSEQDLETFPLLYYTAKRWWDHAREQTYKDTTREVRFLRNEQRRQDCFLVSTPGHPWQLPFDKTFQMGTFALPLASSSNSPEVVKGLIAAGEDISYEDEQLGSALYAAIRVDHEGVVRLLLDAGADVNLRGPGKSGILQHAAYYGSQVVFPLLLRAKVEAKRLDHSTSHVSSKEGGGKISLPHAGLDFDTDVALRTAAEKGNERIVRMLLDAGADIDACNKNNEPALLLALLYGHERIAHMLLDAGADVNVVSLRIFMGSALEGASAKGFERIVQRIIDAGAEVRAHGIEALAAASGRGHERVVQMLLDAGANVSARAKHGATPLCAASRKGHERVVRMLLDAGVDTTLIDEHGPEALVAALDKNHEKVARLLVGTIANHVRKRELCGEVLIAAAGQGLTAVVLSLLEARADATFVGKSGRSAHESAAASSRRGGEVVQCLLDAMADVSHKEIRTRALVVAIEAGQIETVQMLLEAGADATFVDHDGNNALVIASGDGLRRNQEELVKILLDATASVPREEVCRKALGMASYCRKWKVAQILLEAIIDAPMSEQTYQEVFIEASRVGSTEIARRLLKRMSTDGLPHEEVLRQALIAASQEGHLEIVRSMIEATADLSHGGLYQEAFVGAAESGHVPVVRLLLKEISTAFPHEEVSPTALIKAAENNHFEVVQFLLETPTGVAKEETYRKVLIEALGRGSAEEVVQLLRKRMTNVPDQEIYHQALIKASQISHNTETVDSLLKLTATAPQVTSYRKALITASAWGNDTIVRRLLGAGVDVNDPAAQYHGNWNDELFEPRKGHHSLALQAAVDQVDYYDCHCVTVMTLLNAGANVHARDHNGDSALHLISRRKSEHENVVEIKQMLLDEGADFNF